MSNISSFTPNVSDKLRPKVLFFGMQSNFSTPSLLALLEQHIEVCAVVLPASPVPGRETLPIQRREQPIGSRRFLPLLNMPASPSILQIAWREQIPVWDVYSLSHNETLKILVSYQPDMICVACFSQRIPRAILDLPRFGCLNVHPSLLPANRGPVPLFWTFREGHEKTGVTIHLMNEGMDTGDILAQDTIVVPDGIRYEQLETQCAQSGGILLARVVHSLYEGKALRTPQDEAKSYYRSYPSDDDLIVHVEEWDARHLYNFIRGVSHWNGIIKVNNHNNVLLVRDAVSYSHNDANNDECRNMGENREVVQCKTGFVVVNSLPE